MRFDDCADRGTSAATPGPDLPGLVRGLRGVVLDMDGTLLDSEGAYRIAFAASLTSMGRAFDGGLYARLVGLSGRERAPLVAAHHGPDFPWDAFLRDYRDRKAALLAIGLPVKPAVGAFLDELAALNLPWAVATSATRRTAEAALGRAGLLSRAAALVTRDDAAAGKPDPAIPRRAAEALGASPDRVLAVEDSPPGLRAARSAGLRVVMVPDTLPPPPDLLRLGLAVLPDLLALRDLMRRHADEGGFDGGASNEAVTPAALDRLPRPAHPGPADDRPPNDSTPATGRVTAAPVTPASVIAAKFP